MTYHKTTKETFISVVSVLTLAPGAGLEPATYWLTASCSTIELPRNKRTLPVVATQELYPKSKKLATGS